MPVPASPISFRTVESVKQQLTQLDHEQSDDLATQLYTLLGDSYRDDTSSSTGPAEGYSLSAVQAVVTLALIFTAIFTVMFVVWLKLRRANGNNARFTLPSLRMPSIRMPRFGRDNANVEESPASPSSSAFSFSSRRSQANNVDERTSRLLDNDGLDSSSDQYTIRDRI